MKLQQYTLKFFFSFASKYLVGAQVPPNDLCDGAVMVGVGSTTTGTTVGSTNDVNCVSSQSPGVWYKAKGTGEVFEANTCTNTNTDTLVSVFSGSCGSLACVSINDDSIPCGDGLLQSRVLWLTVTGQDYYILVQYYEPAGTFELHLESGAQLPPNDLCNGAVMVGVGSTTAGTTVGSTDDVDCDGVQSPGVWYKAKGTGEVFEVNTCTNTNLDTFLSVFSGSCGSLACVSSNDDSDDCGAGSQSRVFWPTVTGQDYHILVGSYQPLVTGSYVLELAGLAPSSKPSAKPSRNPSQRPSSIPSVRPSSMPSVRPSSMPTSNNNGPKIFLGLAIVLGILAVAGGILACKIF